MKHFKFEWLGAVVVDSTDHYTKKQLETFFENLNDQLKNKILSFSKVLKEDEGLMFNFRFRETEADEGAEAKFITLIVDGYRIFLITFLVDSEHCSINTTSSTVRHEMVHADQSQRGDLSKTDDRQYTIWKNQKYHVSLKDNALFYYLCPWEKEAYMEEYLQRFDGDYKKAKNHYDKIIRQESLLQCLESNFSFFAFSLLFALLIFLPPLLIIDDVRSFSICLIISLPLGAILAIPFMLLCFPLLKILHWKCYFRLKEWRSNIELSFNSKLDL